MNAASVLVICIVAGLPVCAVVRFGKGRADVLYLIIIRGKGNLVCKVPLPTVSSGMAV